MLPSSLGWKFWTQSGQSSNVLLWRFPNYGYWNSSMCSFFKHRKEGSLCVAAQCPCRKFTTAGRLPLLWWMQNRIVLSDLHELQQENSLSIWLDIGIGQVWMTAVGETSKSLGMNSASWLTSSPPYQNACFTPNYAHHSSSVSECMLTHIHGKDSSIWRITRYAVGVD